MPGFVNPLALVAAQNQNGIVPSDTTGNETPWWQVIAGGVLDNGADFINAFKGNTPVYNLNVPDAQAKNDYTMIIVALVALVILVVLGMFIFKKHGK